LKKLFTWVKSNKILSITVLWLILGFIALVTHWILFKTVNWIVLTGFATWVLAGGVFAAFVQIRESQKSTNAQIAMELFRELRNEKAIKKMRQIYELESHVKYLSLLEKKDVDYILDRLDTLGNLVKMGIIDKKLAIETYGGPPALRFWYKLKDYIEQIREQRGFYADNFEGFVNASINYLDENKIVVNYYNKGEEDKLINLVFELRGKEFSPRSWKQIETDRKNKKQ